MFLIIVDAQKPTHTHIHTHTREDHKRLIYKFETIETWIKDVLCIAIRIWLSWKWRRTLFYSFDILNINSHFFRVIFSNISVTSERRLMCPKSIERFFSHFWNFVLLFSHTRSFVVDEFRLHWHDTIVYIWLVFFFFSLSLCLLLVIFMIQMVTIRHSTHTFFLVNIYYMFQHTERAHAKDKRRQTTQIFARPSELRRAHSHM